MNGAPSLDCCKSINLREPAENRCAENNCSSVLRLFLSRIREFENYARSLLRFRLPRLHGLFCSAKQRIWLICSIRSANKCMFGAGWIFRTKCNYLQVLDLLIFRQKWPGYWSRGHLPFSPKYVLTMNYDCRWKWLTSLLFWIVVMFAAKIGKKLKIQNKRVAKYTFPSNYFGYYWKRCYLCIDKQERSQ